MIKLIKPDKNYLQSYIDAFLEYKKYNITNYNFSNPLEYDIFEKFERYEFERDIPKDHVGSLYCWLVDDEKEMFIGEINIRYRLNDNLLKRGGNIGYGVRKDQWGKGYGTLMLDKALAKAKELGLERVLITCDDNNIASARVMEKNGFVLEDKIENIIDCKKITTRRYWKTI